MGIYPEVPHFNAVLDGVNELYVQYSTAKKMRKARIRILVREGGLGCRQRGYY
jgi:hypothetical protein